MNEREAATAAQWCYSNTRRQAKRTICNTELRICKSSATHSRSCSREDAEGDFLLQGGKRAVFYFPPLKNRRRKNKRATPMHTPMATPAREDARQTAKRLASLPKDRRPPEVFISRCPPVFMLWKKKENKKKRRRKEMNKGRRRRGIVQ